jgi:hypothetical protein
MVQCCIDVSRGTAFGLCFAQVLFTVACIMFSQKREIIVYTLQTPTNTTNLHVHEYPVHVQGLLGVLSLLAFFFAIQTMNSTEHEMISTMDYSLENIERNMAWNSMFWIYVCGSHLLIMGITLNVCDVYLLMFAVLILHYCLYNGCLPKQEVVNITLQNIYFLGYLFSLVLVGVNTQQPALLFWIAAFDYILNVGHTWDTHVSMDTIINCRLFYICCQSLLLCLYYTT